MNSSDERDARGTGRWAGSSGDRARDRPPPRPLAPARPRARGVAIGAAALVLAAAAGLAAAEGMRAGTGAGPTGIAPAGKGAGQPLAAGRVTVAQAGPGAAPGQDALIVDPSDVTADSLISRHQAAPRDPNRGPVTNLPLPRYVSLKGGEGNARRGPSLSHRIDWVFRHSGMPLRVVAEFGHWRRVEDQDGAGGWVHYSLLSGVRTAIVVTDMAELRARADSNGAVVARAEAGAIVRLHECTHDWCRVSGDGEKGWVPKGSLWGVDPGETRE